MTFFHWLKDKIDDDTPIGDLARDVHEEPCSEEAGLPDDYMEWKYFLNKKKACWDAIKTLREAFSEYKGAIVFDPDFDAETYKEI